MANANDYRYLKFISYLQVIGIILVVLGHSFHEYPDGEMGHTLWFYRLLYNVRMPLFTFVSGYLMYYTSFVAGRRGRSTGAFTLNKARRLLLPYLTLSLVTFVPRATMSGMADDAVALTVPSLLRSLVDSECMVIPYFWFLHMSFILLVCSYAVLSLARRRGVPLGAPLLGLTVLFAVLPLMGLPLTSLFAIRDVVRLGLFFTLGMVYCRYGPWLDRRLHTSSPVAAVAYAAVWAALYFGCEDVTVRRVASVSGILAFVTFSHILEQRRIGVLDHLQGANYIIFLLSWYVNVAAQQVLAHYVTLPWWVHTLLSLTGGIYIPWLCLKLMQRHRGSRAVQIAALLLGQNLRERPRAEAGDAPHVATGA